MYFEAFTHAKDPAARHLNEDRIIVHGDSLFAVVDGVTDKSGLRHRGLSGGQLAGRLIDRILGELDASGELAALDAPATVAAINDSFRDAYRQLGLETKVQEDPNVRFGAQLCFVHVTGDEIRIVQVGDCGVRLDGRLLFQGDQPGDRVVASLRSRVFRALSDAGTGLDESLKISRDCTVSGLARLPGQRGLLGEDQWSALKQEILKELPGEFPDLPEADVRAAAEGGLLFLSGFRNTAGPLGFACLDGSEIPAGFINETRLPVTGFTHLELFSDGYFGQPERAGRVSFWEEHLLEVEKTDPYKTGPYASTKGSAPGRFTDDRTVLILRKETPEHART